jgi:hypothetical protein
VVRSVLLEEMGLGPGEVTVIGVWIDMLPSDGRKAAEKSTSIYEPFPHVLQFHDPGRIIGSAVAESIGAPGRIAWDMYLLYGAEAMWKRTAPKPIDWAHQLGGEKWADEQKYYWEADLAEALHIKMQALLEGRRSS